MVAEALGGPGGAGTGAVDPQMAGAVHVVLAVPTAGAAGPLLVTLHGHPAATTTPPAPPLPVALLLESSRAAGPRLQVEARATRRVRTAVPLEAVPGAVAEGPRARAAEAAPVAAAGRAYLTAFCHPRCRYSREERERPTRSRGCVLGCA